MRRSISCISEGVNVTNGYDYSGVRQIRASIEARRPGGEIVYESDPMLIEVYDRVIAGQLSEGKAYQQYVTDGEGKAKWEEKPFLYLPNYKGKIWMDNQTLTGFVDGHFESGDDLFDGEWYWDSDVEYTVVWDGVEYTGLMRHNDALGGDGYPFTMYLYEYVDIYATDSSDSHTVSVWEMSLSKSVSTEQEGIGGVGSRHTSFVSDIGVLHPGFFYRVECVLNATYNGIEYTDSIIKDVMCAEDASGEYAEMYLGMNFVLGASGGYVNVSYMYGNNGTDLETLNNNISYSGSKGATVQFNVTITRGVKYLDEGYIPGTIQRVGDDVIVKSSTEGSTKRFKITVDDSGTLTATEVTD